MICEGLFTVGLCGRSGSGKGYVSKCFALKGIPAIDTDAVYRSLTDGSGPFECNAELASVFGQDILREDMSLDRRRLAKIVFAEGAEHKLKMLNEITHKYIFVESLRLARLHKAAGARSIILDAPVLFESGFDYYCDKKLCVTCPDEVSVSRICRRDGISAYEAERRISSQMPPDELRRRCDGEIVNDGLVNVLSEVDRIISLWGLKDE